MRLATTEQINSSIRDGIGYCLLVGLETRSLLLDFELGLPDDIKVAVVFVFRNERQETLDYCPSGMNLSGAYGMPFYYIKSMTPAPRVVELPDKARYVEIHLINWSRNPFTLKRAQVFANLSTDEIPDRVEPKIPASQFRPDLTNFLRICQNNEEEHLIQIDSDCSYEEHFEIFGPDEVEANNKSVLLIPRFYDEFLQPIPNHENKYSISPEFGDYVYLSASSSAQMNTIPVDTPENAKWYGYHTIKRSSKEVMITNHVLEKIGLSRIAQINKIHSELSALADKNATNIMLIYTGTTRIGEKHRANRSMMMAIELAAMGWSVIYIYYRSNQRASILEDQCQPVQSGGQIVQIPNDLCTEFSDWIAKMGKQKGTALLTMPDAGSLPLINHLQRNGWTCAYEARDDWEEFHRVGAGNWYSTNFERYLARKANFTLSVSPPLREKIIAMGARRVHSHILANGAGELFHQHFMTTCDTPRKAPEIGGKIGYFGHLTQQWFDWSALVNLARQNPDQQIEIIGHGHHPEIALPNVSFLGPKSHAEIIEIAQDWSVGIIPFVPSRLANAVDPIKIYEYLCLRLKVVSIFMEQIVDYPNTHLYMQSGELATAVDKAQATPFDNQLNAEFCRACSWQHRVIELVSHFEGMKV